MIRPGPAKLWVFADESPDSINDAGIAVQIASVTSGGVYIDCPTGLHNASCPFSFADGHVEMHHWLGSILGKAPFIQGGLGATVSSVEALAYPSKSCSGLDLKDLNWMQARTSYPQSPVNQAGFPQQ
jgi:prepilin-type processing-associated H-X9-DG protein